MAWRVSGGWRGAVAVAAALAGGEARAGDTLLGTRDHAVSERGHRMTLRLERGYATVVVRRTVHNASRRPDEAVYSFFPPDGGVVVGVRMRADDGQRWHAGRLLAADAAFAGYRARTGVDRARAGPSGATALLAWQPDGLSLDLFPVAAGGERTVEYTIDMPAYWEEGRWRVDLGDPWNDEELAAQLVVQAADPADRLYVDDVPVAQGHGLRLADDAQIGLEPRARRTTTLELAALPTGGERSFVHWRLALADPLVRIPRHVHVVIAFDVSRSLAVGVDEAQRQAARAYLEHLRGAGLAARVALLGFDRRVRPLSAGFVSVERALRLLAAEPPASGNGSDVALALREAGRLLAGAPVGAPRRVLLLSDLLTGSRRTLAEHAAAASGTGALVHLARVHDDSPKLRRDDEDPWAEVAARTQGVLWWAAANADPDDRAQMLALFEGWARPVRVDALAVRFGRGGALHELETGLDEGDVLEDQLYVDATVDEVTVRGLTWNIPYAVTARRSGPLSRRWASLVFASPLRSGLSEDEQRHLVKDTRAVTPWTSYLVAAPGAGPSRDGILRDGPPEEGILGKGGGGGSGSGYGRGTSAGFGGRLDRQEWLEDALAARWDACGGAGRGARIELETTFEELVEFTVQSPGPEDLALAACMHEATWALWLPAADFIDPRRRWLVLV